MTDSTRSSPHRHDFRVVIGAGIWRGFDVTIEPPTSGHPLRHFKTHPEATAYALQVQHVEGWPITDSTEARS